MAAQPQRPPPGPLAKIWAVVSQLMVFYLLFQGARYFFAPAGPAGAAQGPSLDELAIRAAKTCTFAYGDNYRLMVFTSYDYEFSLESSKLVWEQTGLRYTWEDSNERVVNMTLDVTPELLANRSLYAHVFAIKGSKPPRVGLYGNQVSFVYNLTKNMPKPKVVEKKNLVAGLHEHKDQQQQNASETATTAPNETAPAAIEANATAEAWPLYWKPLLDIRIMGDAYIMRPSATPQQLYYLWKVKEDRYWPPFLANEFWLKYEMMMPVNETLDKLPLEIRFSPIGFTKLSIFIQTESQMRMQMALTGGVVEQEMDELKRIILETNPWFLGLTMLVSTVHMFFDFLAFKNDISFWKSRKSMVGLSVRTLIMGCAMQLVIFLYLLDNETSWMILISAGIGVAIDMWKITKAVKVGITKKFGWLPWITMTDRESYTKSGTKEYDDKAMRYLSYILYPLVACYAIYSLAYETHKSWYSWVLGSLTGAVYTFGFIMMTPQLFINYKLKSVAHLPWRALIYKSLNTFIDDLFAFIIKMPTLHRLACFRDDIVFLIYLYQRWIYPADKTRMESLQWEDAANDFADQQEAKAHQKQPAEAPASAQEKKTN
eukprot:m51a1_g7717 putative cleft lip and palate transmembrane protein 1 (600) ;mRNA; f:124295-126800